MLPVYGYTSVDVDRREDCQHVGVCVSEIALTLPEAQGASCRPGCRAYASTTTAEREEMAASRPGACGW